MAGAKDLGVDFGKDVFKKTVKHYLNEAMKKHKASPEVRKVVLFVIDNSVEYVDFCIKHNKKPDDKKVLTEFLVSKGLFLTKLGPDDIKCAVALVEFANNLRKNVPKAKGPVPATIVASLTLIDALNVGNNCTFVQEAYYRNFQQTSTPRTVPLKRRSEPTDDPLSFLKSSDNKSKLQCLGQKSLNDGHKAKQIEIILP